jgi:hypothetical protein
MKLLKITLEYDDVTLSCSNQGNELTNDQIYKWLTDNDIVLDPRQHERSFLCSKSLDLANEISSSNIENSEIYKKISDFSNDIPNGVKISTLSYLNSVFLNILLNELDKFPKSAEERCVESRKFICEKITQLRSGI